MVARDSGQSDPQVPQSRCHVTFINGRLTALVEQMSDFARSLSALAQRAVVDETGLTGPFEIEMTFNPGTFFNGRGFTPGAMDDLPAFSNALRDELGLNIETQRRPVTVIVVEHVETPTAN